MPGWLSLEWGRLRAKHGVKGAPLHSVRHWHASTLIRAGVDVTEVAKRLGHAQTSTTVNVYGHLVPGVEGKSPAVVADAMKQLQSPRGRTGEES